KGLAGSINPARLRERLAEPVVRHRPGWIAAQGRLVFPYGIGILTQKRVGLCQVVMIKAVVRVNGQRGAELRHGRANDAGVMLDGARVVVSIGGVRVQSVGAFKFVQGIGSQPVPPTVCVRLKLALESGTE